MPGGEGRAVHRGEHGTLPGGVRRALIDDTWDVRELVGRYRHFGRAEETFRAPHALLEVAAQARRAD